MEFDVMTRATTWDHVATLARRTEAAGFSGMLFTEGHRVPWMASPNVSYLEEDQGENDPKLT